MWNRYILAIILSIVFLIVCLFVAIYAVYRSSGNIPSPTPTPSPIPSPTPSPSPESCGSPPSFTSGVVKKCTGYVEGSTCPFWPKIGQVCDSDVITCSGGRWTVPKCTKSDGPGCSAVPSIPNATTSCDGKNWVAGGYKCEVKPNQGYTCNQKYIGCKSDGTWGDSPECIKVNCIEDPDSHHFPESWTISSSNCDKSKEKPYPDGTVCTAVAATGYACTGASATATCNNGVWSYDISGDCTKNG